jgi:predicted dehydrogenase
MRRARVGVIGAGWWSTQAHIPSLRSYDRADLVGIADPDAGKLAAAAAYYEVDQTYEDYHDLVDKVDGVVIAVPHAYHYEIARDALEAGAHVLVEKPMVLTAAHAWDLVERAGRKGLELMVGSTFQFTSQARRIKEIVRSGGIGELLQVSGLFASIVESFYRGRPGDYQLMFEYPVTGPEPDSYSDPRIAGGGQGQSQLSHALGMVLWVTGHRAVEAFSYMENVDLQVDLVDAVSYRLDNGAIGTMGAAGSLRPGQDQNQEFRYYGSEGQLRQDLIHGIADVYYNDGTSEVLPPLAEDDIYPKHLPARTLADLVLGEGENLAPGAVAARAVELLEAAYKSAASGRPVKIDELDQGIGGGQMP